MQPSPGRVVPRAVRASAYATFAFAVLQMWFLPALVHREAGRWVWEPGTLLHVSLSLAMAVLIWRGSEIATAIVAAYGAWRLGLFLLAVVQVLNGTVAARANGPAFVVSQAVSLPFAIFWLWGGLAVLRARRARRSAGST
ncbi:hypothetical protein [Longimicrobium sp.]|uniref:hypothetical protein n=1 Tax=Longimicrobium sp. TaxID=2029185 RepID=UPI003B3A55A8